MNRVIEPTSSSPPESPNRQSSLANVVLSLKSFVRSVFKLGFPATVIIARARTALARSRVATLAGEATRLGQAETKTIHLKGYANPIHFRPKTSDVYVIQQIFLFEEYRCVASETDIEFIVDCGANIGCTSVYFLSKYPRARLIAVEPDSGNAEICRKNLAPFGDRARVIEAGLWPRDARLKIERGHYRDGLNWSFQVRACRDEEAADINAIGPMTLLAEGPNGRIDLLKIDIERSERVLFSEEVEPWLSKTRTIAIELHDDECRAMFHKAIEPFAFQTTESGELTIARRNMSE